jgi:hypothetical protein
MLTHSLALPGKHGAQIRAAKFAKMVKGELSHTSLAALGALRESSLDCTRRQHGQGARANLAIFDHASRFSHRYRAAAPALQAAEAHGKSA